MESHSEAASGSQAPWEGGRGPRGPGGRGPSCSSTSWSTFTSSSGVGLEDAILLLVRLLPGQQITPPRDTASTQEPGEREGLLEQEGGGQGGGHQVTGCAQQAGGRSLTNPRFRQFLILPFLKIFMVTLPSSRYLPHLASAEVAQLTSALE